MKDPSAPELNDQYVIRSVARALDVLTAIAESPEAPDLSSLARTVGLHPATVFRVLQTLRSRGFVTEAPEGGYRIGPKAFEVGSSFLRGASLWRSGNQIVERLAAITGETANLGIIDGTEVLYIAIAHGQSEIGIQSVAGSRHPLYATALGKVLLAHLPWPEARRILQAAGLRQLTSRTLATIKAQQAELRKVATRGYAVDDEERITGVRCLATPIHDRSGQVVAALSVAGPAFRLAGDTFQMALREAKRLAVETSVMLGYRMGPPPATSAESDGNLSRSARAVRRHTPTLSQSR